VICRRQGYLAGRRRNRHGSNPTRNTTSEDARQGEALVAEPSELAQAGLDTGDWGLGTMVIDNYDVHHNLVPVFVASSGPTCMVLSNDAVTWDRGVVGAPAPGPHCDLARSGPAGGRQAPGRMSVDPPLGETKPILGVLPRPIGDRAQVSAAR